MGKLYFVEIFLVVLSRPQNQRKLETHD